MPYERATDPKPPIGAKSRHSNARRITLNERGWFLSLRDGQLLGPFPTVYVTREASLKLRERLADVDAGRARAIIQAIALEYQLDPPDDPPGPRGVAA
jgi:hypothetical protein